MRYYFAPMEGLTDCIYRQLHQKYFPGVDRYYTPFFSPTVHRSLTPKEAQELPEVTENDVATVPQILTKSSEDFLWMSQQCAALGYKEVNLNLGCPSGTVTAKGKGSGMLRDLEKLAVFLDEIFTSSALPISVKTRIGFSDPSEFSSILQLLNQYPIQELTVHPRVREDFYKGSICYEAFTLAEEKALAPLCYNGDVNSLSEADTIQKRFPKVQAIMVGRGLIRDPGMFTDGGTTAAQLEGFMDALFDSYHQKFGSARNTMFRMKEHWGMLVTRFENAEKLAKALRKTTDLAQFRSLTHELLHCHRLLD